MSCRPAPCFVIIAIDNEIHLASIEMLPTTSLRLAINDASTSWRSSQPQRSRVHRRYAKVNADLCDERNTGEMAHSRLAGQEIKLICNRKFV
jgi:hypothetical protein